MTRPEPATDISAAALELYRRTGQHLESTIRGNSMGDTLSPGSRIRIRLESAQRYETGDVVAFLVDGRPVAHRVRWSVRRGREGYLVLIGDGLRVPDPPVHLSEVIGVIEAVWGAGGWVPLPARRVKGWWSEVTRQAAAAIVVVALIFGPTLGRRAAGLLARVESALTGRSAHVNSTS